MTLERIDNVGVVVADLPAAIAFFEELGLRLEGEARIEGAWSDRVVGLDGQLVDIAMMRTPDGKCGLELMSYLRPDAVRTQPHPVPPNALGIGRIMFAVTGIDEVLARLETHGATLVGEVVNYENVYRLCYIRGPEGILLALAEKIG